MPLVKNRIRNCQHCDKEFSLDDEGCLKKYCSVKCRGQFHWKKGGTEYRNSDKGKATMFSWRLRTTFGITVDDYNKMLEAQGNTCAICQRADPTGYGWHVDHCHKTMKVRGILCSKCNQGIGLLDENIETIKKAINYLENSTNLS